MVPRLDPVVLREAIAAFALTVAVPEPEFASKMTALAEVGTAQPNAPPLTEAQWLVSLQLPDPRTQYRFAPQAGEMVTKMLGSLPSMLKTTCPDPLTVPEVNAAPFFSTLHRFAGVFPPIVNVIVSVVRLSAWLHPKLLLTVQAVKLLIVMSAVASLSVTVKLWTFTEPSPRTPVAFTVNALNAML
jgi:hypothetical protein